MPFSPFLPPSSQQPFLPSLPSSFSSALSSFICQAPLLSKTENPDYSCFVMRNTQAAAAGARPPHATKAMIRSESYGKVFPNERNTYGYQHKSNQLPKMATVQCTGFGYDEFRVQRERITTEIIIIRPAAISRRGRRKDSTWRGIGRDMATIRVKRLKPPSGWSRWRNDPPRHLHTSRAGPRPQGGVAGRSKCRGADHARSWHRHPASRIQARSRVRSGCMVWAGQ